MALELLKSELETEGFFTLIIGEELAVGPILMEHANGAKTIQFSLGIKRQNETYIVRFVTQNRASEVLSSADLVVTFVKTYYSLARRQKKSIRSL